MSNIKKALIAFSIFSFISVLYVFSLFICIPALFDGMTIAKCPSGKVIPVTQLSIPNAIRGETSTFIVKLKGLYVTKAGGETHLDDISTFSAQLFLVSSEGTETPLTIDEQEMSKGELKGQFVFPKVTDGPYEILVRSESPFGESMVSAPIELYSIARGHLLTDRPLYEPGNHIQARAVLLNSRSLNPLGNRKGRWILENPFGVAVEEKIRQTDEWGVTATDFYLEDDATVGEWTVSFLSGDFEMHYPITVEPFTLPRFTVSFKPDKTYYLAGDTPKLSGEALFSSGAPVQNATVDIQWFMEDFGKWMPPTNWEGDTLIEPQLKTDKRGKFTITFPEIPEDLQGTANIIVNATTLDKTGETVYSQSTIKLSKEPIKVDAITESTGLTSGQNNRMYVRVARPDNTPVKDTEITLTKSWDNTDGGITAQTDRDGIASIQIDPGNPINIVVPALPYRPPLPQSPLELVYAVESINRSNATLNEKLAFMNIESSMDHCASLVLSETYVDLYLYIRSNGQVIQSDSNDSFVGDCLLDIIKKVRFPTTGNRLLNLQYKIRPSQHPTPSISYWGSSLIPWQNLWSKTQLQSRSCLKEDRNKFASIVMAFHSKVKSTQPTIEVISSVGLSKTEKNCIVKNFKNVPPTEVKSNLLGGITLTFTPYEPYSASMKPQATTHMGYEFNVAAKGIGEALLRQNVTETPNIRLRAEPSIARSGQNIKLEILRGPNFTGHIPSRIVWEHPDGESSHHNVDKESRSSVFKLPEEKVGWYQTEILGKVARIFVPSKDALDIVLSTDSDVYKPKDEATLHISVSQDGEPVEAAIGLFGVDKSLEDLVGLPGPNSQRERIVMTATSDARADDLGLTGAMLMQGQISGENAMLAAMTFINDVPVNEDFEVAQNVFATSEVVPEALLIDHFFVLLKELHHQALLWESNTQVHEQMKPEVVVQLWEKALESCRKQGLTCQDTFGHDLLLTALPPELLNLTDPRFLVVEGTRLPEDMVNWDYWVKENL